MSRQAVLYAVDVRYTHFVSKLDAIGIVRQAGSLLVYQTGAERSS